MRRIAAEPRANRTLLRGFSPRYELPKPQTAEEIVERAMQSGV